MQMERVSKATWLGYGLAAALSLALSLFPANIQDFATPDDGGDDEAAIGAQHAILLPWAASHVGASLVLEAIVPALPLVALAAFLVEVLSLLVRSAAVSRLYIGNIRAPPQMSTLLLRSN